MGKNRTKISIPAYQTVFLLSLLILYAIPSAGRFFYRDDFAFIFWTRVNSLGDLWKVISQPLQGNVFYRPIGNISYSLDWFLWGTNAFMYSLHDILWQLFSIFMIYKTVKLITGKENIALLSEALFIFYFPMNSGSVSILTNRFGVMAIAFCLLSFYYFFKMRLGKNGGAVSILFFALAVFTKELAAPFIFVFMVADLLYFRKARLAWGYYLSCFAVLLLRYLAGRMAGTSSPIGGATSDYSFVFGANIINNFAYYASWLLLPAIVIVATLYLLSLANGLRIDMKKAFPKEVSVFGLSLALINLLPYLPFAGYRQLGWLHMSTIGMAIFLASPTYYFLDLLSSKRNVRKSLVFAAAALTIFLVVISALFLPSKLILRNRQAGYSKRFINDFIKLNIGKDKKVYVVDTGSKDYHLSDTFISPMVNKEVLYEAIYLFDGKKTPKEIHLVDKAGNIHRTDADTVILYYRNGRLSNH